MNTIKNKVIKSIMLILILIVLILSGKIGYEYIEYRSNKMLPGDSQEVVIPRGASTKKISEVLKQENIIFSEILFRVNSRLNKYDGKYKYGSFTINNNMSYIEIMEALISDSNRTDVIKITIPEGASIKQIGNILEQKNITTAEEFIRIANEEVFVYPFLEYVDDREYKLEGYLFPDTYEITADTEVKSIIKIMLDRFNGIFKQEYFERAKVLGYTIDEIVTIASIIEKEAKIEIERKKMAGVIYNRLDTNMQLQMCSTVIYALGEHRDRLYDKDLQIDSPYNTYINMGIPKGPISSPGQSAILAALYPDDHDYYYFVLKNEVTGEHVFTKTYSEHLVAKNRYINQQQLQ